MTESINMILYCPSCYEQHIDAPTPERKETIYLHGVALLKTTAAAWNNPPHRSHLCALCGYIWRPADVPTTGVAKILTAGKNDSPPLENLYD